MFRQYKMSTKGKHFVRKLFPFLSIISQNDQMAQIFRPLCGKMHQNPEIYCNDVGLLDGRVCISAKKYSGLPVRK